MSAIAKCNGMICSGAMDGTIRVLRPPTGLALHVLSSNDNSEPDGVDALVVWKDLLISAHGSGSLRVWNVVDGKCVQVLQCRKGIFSLAVCGSLLACGIGNQVSDQEVCIQVWRMLPSDPWRHYKDLIGQTGCIWSLAGREGKVVSGSDASIWVWDAEAGEHEATLAGHSGAVHALVVLEDRLLSASDDGTLRSWALGTWEGLQMVQAYAEGTGMYPYCLAVSGSKLLSGSRCTDDEELVSELQVWGLAELDLQQTLLEDADVTALVAVDGEVWGGLDSAVAAGGLTP